MFFYFYQIIDFPDLLICVNQNSEFSKFINHSKFKKSEKMFFLKVLCYSTQAPPLCKNLNFRTNLFFLYAILLNIIQLVFLVEGGRRDHGNYI